MADISSIVQESPRSPGSCSATRRTGALADRFEGESKRLADLEVRAG